MRLMYDGIDTDAAIIRSKWQPGDLVAVYLAGNSYIWDAAQRGLFPADSQVTITLTASYLDADVLDVEAGGATVAEVAGWITAKRLLGYDRPTVYCSLSILGAIRQATGALVLGRDWDAWVADWDGSTTDPVPLAAAKQFRDAGPYDVSAVYDAGWPHRTAATPPVSTVPTVPADVWPAGVVLRPGATGGAVRVLQEALNATHLPGVRNITVDGVFANQTLTSVRNFQALEGLVVDGIAGPATRAKLGV